MAYLFPGFITGPGAAGYNLPGITGSQLFQTHVAQFLDAGDAFQHALQETGSVPGDRGKARRFLRIVEGEALPGSGQWIVFQAGTPLRADLAAQRLDLCVGEMLAQHGAAAVGGAPRQPAAKNAMAVDAVSGRLQRVIHQDLAYQGAAQGSEGVAGVLESRGQGGGGAVRGAGHHLAAARQSRKGSGAGADPAHGAAHGKHLGKQSGGQIQLPHPCGPVLLLGIVTQFQAVVLVSQSKLPTEPATDPFALVQRQGVAGDGALFLQPQQLGQAGARTEDGRLIRRQGGQPPGLFHGAPVIVHDAGAQGMSPAIAEQQGAGGAVQGDGSDFMPPGSAGQFRQYGQNRLPPVVGILLRPVRSWMPGRGQEAAGSRQLPSLGVDA